MPWYIWLIILVTLGSIIGSLLMLRKTAQRIPLTQEQKERIAKRNAQLDAEEEREKRERDR
ncbi:DUF2897 family protein [Azomonas macrocytogenes]|uniref:Heme exporter protein D n=1 Tax=Azomonas macrocytogenes TaxID=69962 RepID=A0A839T008_AZOMA|nr:DUF2897 family protein [Azomonas macrocytogenes]MBB3101846.1 heme exporter protein D [Azomonas macrocytogenes]